MPLKPAVLILVPCYLPGVKSGGPITSIANFAEAMGDDLDIRIISSDRDEGDENCYPELPTREWIDQDKARVMYLPPEDQGLSGWLSLLKNERADFLYINSFFSLQFSLLPILARAAGATGQPNLIIAPRGQFAPGALSFKWVRKQIILGIAKLLPVYRSAHWQASSVHEVAHIRQVLGTKVRISEALPFGMRNRAASQGRPDKTPGAIKIVFLGRISPMKNLAGALRMIRDVKGLIDFTIYGPIGNAPYWEECQSEIENLPSTIRVHLGGIVSHEDVLDVLGRHHLFFLPTLGENFGHVINEALSAGCITLTSDQTPWRGLAEAGVGWDLPLGNEEAFRSVLSHCVAMNQSDFALASARCLNFANKFVDAEKVRAQYKAMFGIAAG